MAFALLKRGEELRVNASVQSYHWWPSSQCFPWVFSLEQWPGCPGRGWWWESKSPCWTHSRGQISVDVCLSGQHLPWLKSLVRGCSRPFLQAALGGAPWQCQGKELCSSCTGCWLCCMVRLCSWFIGSKVMPGLTSQSYAPGQIHTSPVLMDISLAHEPQAKPQECNPLFTVFQSYEMVHFHPPTPPCRNPGLAPGLALGCLHSARKGSTKQPVQKHRCLCRSLAAGSEDVFFSTSLCKRFPSPIPFMLCTQEIRWLLRLQCPKLCSQPSSPSVPYSAWWSGF